MKEKITESLNKIKEAGKKLFKKANVSGQTLAFGMGMAAMVATGCASDKNIHSEDEMKAKSKIAVVESEEEKQIKLDKYCNENMDECECDNYFMHLGRTVDVTYTDCRKKTEEEKQADLDAYCNEYIEECNCDSHYIDMGSMVNVIYGDCRKKTEEEKQVELDKYCNENMDECECDNYFMHLGRTVDVTYTDCRLKEPLIINTMMLKSNKR